MINSHLHILHLSRRTDRYANLTKQLEFCNITDYTIWEGYDDPTNVKRAITKGHKDIVRLAKDQGMPNCIIAEDDIVFTHPDSYKYFIEQTPQDYDLFFGLIYSGQVNEENRVINGMSGVMTLYNISARFYDFFLSQPDGEHIDRGLGNYCYQFKFMIVPEYCCYQSGGYSDNIRREMYYHEYLRGKKMYGME